MSAIAYQEPYKLPAGVLALLVHGAFFTLLYFGISWRTDPAQGMVVDIWESLPAPEVARVKVEPPPAEQVEPPKPVETPPVEQVEPPKPVEPAQPVALPKADIELVEKKKPKIKPVEVKKPVEIKKVIPPKKAEPVKVDQKALAEQRAQAEQAEQAAQAAELERARAAQAAAAAAVGKVVNEFKTKIGAKIRSKIVMPPDVPDNAKAEFDVTLLPGGSVLSVRLVKPSGNEAYDGAVERAISKSQPLPLPPDVALFNNFRELHLKFCPEEILCN